MNAADLNRIATILATYDRFDPAAFTAQAAGMVAENDAFSAWMSAHGAKVAA